MSKIGDKYIGILGAAESYAQLHQAVENYRNDMMVSSEPDKTLSFAEAKQVLGSFFKIAFPGRGSAYFGIPSKRIKEEEWQQKESARALFEAKSDDPSST